jgi:hypothetical protein
MKRATPRETGNRTLSDKLNEELIPAGDSVGTPTASGALPITRSRMFRLNGSNLAMTVAAPTIANEGVCLFIRNIAGTDATVTVTGMDAPATADVITLTAAGATAHESVELTCYNVGTTAVPSYKWVPRMYVGVTVA